MGRADERDEDLMAGQFIRAEEMVPSAGGVFLVEYGRRDRLAQASAVTVKPEAKAMQNAREEGQRLVAHGQGSKKNSSSELKLSAKPAGNTGCGHGGVGATWET